MAELQSLADIYADQDKWQSRADNAHKRMDIAARSLSRATDHLGIVPMVEAIAKLLRPQFPNHVLNVLGPFGLGNTTSIHAYRLGLSDRHRKLGGGCVGSLTFRPDDDYNTETKVLRRRLVMVDYNQDTRQYPKGSLGDYNGLNYVEVPLDGVDLVATLWASIQEKEKTA